MKKRALLVGNSKYDCTYCGNLPGVYKDIELMHKKFDEILFHDIFEECDVDENQIDKATRTFLNYDNPQADDINVIYYSGHGVTVDSQLNIVTPSSHTHYGLYSITKIIDIFDGNPSNLIIILDMCRSHGIDTIPSPKGNNITIAYATGAGTESGMYANGPSFFTECLAKKLTMINASITSIVVSINEELDKHSQVPATYQSAKREPILNPLSLDMEWFKDQTNTAIKNLGKRYCPEVNVSVGLEGLFSALCFDNSFIEEIRDRLDIELSECDKTVLEIVEKKDKDGKLSEIRQFLPEKVKMLRSSLGEFIENLTIENIQASYLTIDKISILCKEIIEFCYEKDRDEAFEKVYDEIRQIFYHIDEIQDTVNSQTIMIALKPCVYLHGNGGIGKSHSIAHLVYSRTMQNKPSILLVGSEFLYNNDPDVQIMHDLRLDCSFEILLDYLNSIGKKNNTRVLLCIDALNEGQGKDIWKSKLNATIDSVSRFPWIALLVSSRTFFYDSLINSDSIGKDTIIPIRHPGFTKVGFDSVIKYFEHYEIDWQPSLLMLREFSNPLFLRLFCEGYANEIITEDNISAEKIYQKYIKAINTRIAGSCEYNEHIPAVNDYLILIQEKKYKHIIENIRTRNAIEQLDESEYIEAALEIKRKYGIQKDFLSALFHEDILTNKTIGGKDTFTVTYERIEDYYLSGLIYKKYIKDGKLGNEIVEYLLYYNELLREFICCLANNKQIEIDEVFDINDDNKIIILKAFIHALLWRETSSFTEKTNKIINNYVIDNEQLEYDFWDTIVSLAPYPDHPLNGNSTYQTMMEYKMALRDAIFIPIWDRLFERENSLAIMLTKWMRNGKIQAKAGKEETICACKCICWFLISPNHKVRDLVTEAIQYTFLYHIDIIPELLDDIMPIDDPYVLERILAAVYGSILILGNPSKDIKKIADWIYEKIYCQQIKTTNVMIRDYSSSIIEYAKKHREDCNIYTNSLCNQVSGDLQIPDDSEIEQYKAKLGSKIIHSMRVEYDRQGRPGGYGDFGRYVFQYYFSNWQEKPEYNDLMNIALQNIKSRGYDINMHDSYDMTCRYDRSGPNARERIGKKYQWLALYELAGIIMDQYPVDKYVDEEDKEEVYHSLRNYDPSLIISNSIKKGKNDVHEALYEIDSHVNVQKWLFNYDDIHMNEMNRFIEISVKNKKYYVVKGHFNWKPKHIFGEGAKSGESWGMYLIVNMYFVKKSEFDNTIRILEKQDFMGRWMPEREYGNNYFIRERYWSDIYKINEGDIWQKPDRCVDNINVMVPCISYTSEGKDDRDSANGIRYFLPCGELATECNMKSTDSNTVFTDSHGNVLSFDSSEYLNEPIGLFMDEEMIKQYANEHDLIPIWTILGEKWCTGLSYMDREAKIPGHISGLLYLQEDGLIKGKCSVLDR